MIRVIIKKAGIETHAKKCENQTEANAWIAKHESMENPWGHAPGSYTIDQVNIDEEIEKQKRLMVRMEKRNFGGYIVDYISDINDQKTLTEQDIVNLANTFGTITQLLLQGSITTARGQIAAADLTGSVFTELERTEILGIIDAKLTEW